MTKEECAAVAGKAATKAEREMRVAFAAMHGGEVEPDVWMIDMARCLGANSAWMLLDYDQVDAVNILDLAE